LTRLNEVYRALSGCLVFNTLISMHYKSMNPVEKREWVCEQARILGFDLCGVAPAARFPELGHFSDWLARGYAGEMKYLENPRRADPKLLLDDARSLIVVAMSYNTPQPHSILASSNQAESPRGWISRYAWGDDYHEVMQGKLTALVTAMRDKVSEPFEARAYVDTGPIIERVAAKYAGLGWLGKNTSLINQQMGSWLFLGVIVTTLLLEPSIAPDQPPPADLCGTCTRCLDACPTKAFPEPYVLDARRCISYLTIELRGQIPEEFRPLIGDAVVGCDICQDVCPWNRRAPVSSIAAFQPRQMALGHLQPENRSGQNAFQESSCESLVTNISLFLPELESLARLSQQEFSALFRRSAVKRTKWRGLVRNACVALGNSNVSPDSASYERVVRTLERLVCSDDLTISSHARWALSRITRSDRREVSVDKEIGGTRVGEIPTSG